MVSSYKLLMIIAIYAKLSLFNNNIQNYVSIICEYTLP